MLPALRIIGLCMLAATAYGLVHDQITVRVCVEYFSITHAPILQSRSNLLAEWLYGASILWWVGLIAAFLIVLAARAGRLRDSKIQDMAKACGFVLLVSFIPVITIWLGRTVDPNSPTVLALVWGVVATWWVGLALGILFALAARVGRWPTLGARDLVPSVLILLGVMAAFAMLAGTAGYHLSTQGKVAIPIEAANVVPSAMHHRWMAALYAHNASYNVGILGGLLISALTPLARRRRRTLAPFA